MQMEVIPIYKPALTMAEYVLKTVQSSWFQEFNPI